MTHPDLFDPPARAYPETPGFKRPGTSQAAAESMAPKASTLREACLVELRQANGTADEVAERLGKSILSIRPRISELSKLGQIADSGQRRENESGNRAVVWRAP